MTDSDECIFLASDQHFRAIGLGAVTNGRAAATMLTNAVADLPQVAIIESRRLIRESLVSHISNDSDKITVCPFVSAAECINEASDFSLIIIWLRKQGSEHLELLTSLSSAHRHSKFLLISDHDYQASPDFVRTAWRLGARGFISTRTTGLTAVLSAIRFVLAGGTLAPVDTILSPSPILPQPPPVPLAASELTARETVVMRLLREGKTNKAIARELRVTSNTIKVHVQNILRKMRVSNRTEAALGASSTFAANAPLHPQPARGD